MKTTTHVLAGCILLLVWTGCATAKPQSGHEIARWIAQLHDNDYAKRNTAVQLLAQDPQTAEAALPRLKQDLKQETDPNRCWWLKAAIQECKRNLPQPDEISATPDHSQRLQANDGPFTVVKHDGIRCWKIWKHEGDPWSFLYFKVDDAIREKAWNAVVVELEYLDAGTGDIGLDYDSSDPRALGNGAYETHPLTVRRINSGQWRTVCFRINNARFHGSENYGSDFMFLCHGDSLLIRSVRAWPVKPGN